MTPIPEPPKLPDPPPSENRQIRFRLHYVRHKGKFSARQLKRPQRKLILKKLRKYEEMTVPQFKSSSSVRLRQYNGALPEPPGELSPDVRDTLAQYFRINNKIRLYGYLFDSDFYIIWIDPDHKLSDRKTR